MENRRHHLIILGSYQRKLIISAVMTAILLLNLVLITWFLVDPGLIGKFETRDTFAIALVEVAIIAAIFVLSLFASNKIAGPMYAFDKVLKEIRAGNLSARLHLRPGDICHNVASEMNETFDELENRITAIKEILAKLQELEGNDSTQQTLLSEIRVQLEHFTHHPANDK